jgi:zinc transport system permease protein
VVPVAGATQVARSFREALLGSVVLAELAVLIGITLSFHYEATAGGTIVLVAVGLYVVAVLFGKLGTGTEVDSDAGAVPQEGAGD